MIVMDVGVLLNSSACNHMYVILDVYLTYRVRMFTYIHTHITCIHIYTSNVCVRARARKKHEFLLPSR